MGGRLHAVIRTLTVAQLIHLSAAIRTRTKQAPTHRRSRASMGDAKLSVLLANCRCLLGERSGQRQELEVDASSISVDCVG